MKRIIPVLAMALFFAIASCSREDVYFDKTTTDELAYQQEPMTLKEVNDQITQLLEQQGSFNWKDASDILLYSAAVHGNNLLTVGYGKPGESFSITKSTQLLNVKDEIIKTARDNYISIQKNGQDVLIYDDETLNFVDIKVNDIATVTALRKNKNVRYLEPDGFIYTANKIEKSSSGCSQNAETISGYDYGTKSTGARIPWNFYDHNIDKAWAYSKGRGIGVGIIDTGISSNQAYLGSKFDDYYSGRYVQKYGTYVDSWWPWSTSTDGPYDKCGHGTSASATIAAPDNNAGQYIGVAYECNLVSYRGTEDVVLDGYHERNGVANALKALGNRSDIKVISMSIGYPWSIGKIEDAVKYAYSRGKLIFAAGGTSTEFTNWYGIIFPASMTETVAVTGVEESTSYHECDTCHKGDMDFTVIMERSNNNNQPVMGYNTGTSNYFGGSSVATAFTAGTAALVWARYPSWNRDQVLQRLKEASAFYPNRNSDYGYGNIDALKAVRGY